MTRIKIAGFRHRPQIAGRFFPSIQPSTWLSNQQSSRCRERIGGYPRTLGISLGVGTEACQQGTDGTAFSTSCSRIRQVATVYVPRYDFWLVVAQPPIPENHRFDDRGGTNGVGRRRKETLLDMALTSAWPVAASIAAGMLLFGFVLIPAFFAHNPYLKMAAAGLKPIFVLLSCAFGGIALFKWLATLKAAAKTPILTNVRHPTPQRPIRQSSPVPEPASVIRREPVMNENEVQPESTRAEAWSLELIQAIEWKRFEDVCQKFYELKGIRSECTPLAGC